jgi:hypothetical protein
MCGVRAALIPSLFYAANATALRKMRGGNTGFLAGSPVGSAAS